jgi:hypothetical protein
LKKVLAIWKITKKIAESEFFFFFFGGGEGVLVYKKAKERWVTE